MATRIYYIIILFFIVSFFYIEINKKETIHEASNYENKFIIDDKEKNTNEKFVLNERVSVENIDIKMAKKIFDTSWKTKIRFINGKTVIYNFGDGNPIEVSLTKEELFNLAENVKKMPVLYLTYMTPEAEQSMKDFLESKEFSLFSRKLKNKFPLKNISMESILYVDDETGRKEFNKDFIYTVNESISYGKNPLNNEQNNFQEKEDKTLIDNIYKSWNSVLENYFIEENTSEQNTQFIPTEIIESSPPINFY